MLFLNCSYGKFAFYLLSLVLGTIFWCEYLIYFVNLSLRCSWPSLNREDLGENHRLDVMVLSDTHLLGTVKGHWFDKLRREWQMYRSFQTAMTLYQPKVVFILGDVFDEGQWASDQDFDRYVERFNSIFGVPSDVKLYVVAGNHDIGFHYWTNYYYFLNERFEQKMNVTAVDYLNDGGVYFVRINSIALEGDRCSLCQTAIKEIERLNRYFTKLRNRNRQPIYPILLTHFPMYRPNESVCLEDDSAPELKSIAYRPRIDCLSAEASLYLLEKLKPRLILNGHVHHSCLVNHTVEALDHQFHPVNRTISEWTVASFSWRNKLNPSFLLLQTTKFEHAIRKCFLPHEHFVFLVYGIVAAIVILSTLLFAFTKIFIKFKND